MMALSKAFEFTFDFSNCADYKIKSSILMICMHSMGKNTLFTATVPFCTDISESNNSYEMLGLLLF